jgi:hypothetical protein
MKAKRCRFALALAAGLSVCGWAGIVDATPIWASGVSETSGWLDVEKTMNDDWNEFGLRRVSVWR